MTALGERIAALIAAQGPMSIAEFMTLALHDPLDGYYATRDPFGSGGDFVTAPEVSQMFGEIIGLWLAQCWHDQGKPKRPLLVELGPGRGTLMADALRAMKLMPDFRAQLDVVLIEASPVLRKVQAQTLHAGGVTPRWAGSLGEIETGRPVFLIANEFFDALPIRQFVMTEGGWRERMVTLAADGSLGFALSPVPYPAAPQSRAGAPIGGVYESCAAGDALAEEIAHRIGRDGGAALVIDYGYDTPGFGETLQAVKAHGFAAVLTDPGASDLSAHVDFAALAAAAERGGAAVYGPEPQGAFLAELGLLRRAERLKLFEEARRLTSAAQMGTLFKALAILPKGAPAPPGF